MTDQGVRRGLNDRELTQLQETGTVQTLGGFTLASLIASLNQLGLGPEDVEVCGNGENFGIELAVYDPELEAEANEVLDGCADWVPCPECEGSGVADGLIPGAVIQCPECDGRGKRV